MSIIAAGTTAGTALKSTGNTDGTIQLQVNGTTPSVTLATTGAIGVGSTPGYGTSGQVLTSAGSAAAPTWSALSAPTAAQGASLVYLSTVTASSSSTVDIETTFDSTYDNYVIVASNITVSATANLFIRLKISGTYATASYAYHTALPAMFNASYAALGSASAGQIISGASIQATAASAANYNFYIWNPAGTTNRKGVYFQGFFTDSSDTGIVNSGAGQYFGSTAACTGVRFLLNTGTITTGTFRLYGIKNS